MSNDLTFFTNEPGASLLDRFKSTLAHVQYFDVLVGHFTRSQLTRRGITDLQTIADFQEKYDLFRIFNYSRECPISRKRISLLPNGSMSNFRWRMSVERTCNSITFPMSNHR
ncbi:hypothetical protein [Candidatus Amarolinea dominans]|uniref:hypothetical protein n=1 Tax=Candidatus Amarolinea dominans TaxID=3140696 RepID=UPI001D36BCAD|nr:hypothetical protein [Anaerolineae bacterium]